ncbi:MAG TPA: hypothetical protein EYH14_01420, partial [Euryarchaeota archaeon]|nr:hypothetical protein [Euryarchaeota archaeon]
ESPPADMIGRLIRKVFTCYRLPYISITPTFSICPIHGYIPGYHQYCPYPHTEEELRKAGLLRDEVATDIIKFSVG